MNEPFLVAAAQLAPAFLDLETSIDKACQWITKAGEENVKVLVFPETWLPVAFRDQVRFRSGLPNSRLSPNRFGYKRVEP